MITPAFQLKGLQNAKRYCIIKEYTSIMTISGDAPMVLKGRLKLIYDMIPQCNILSDVGTDHAFIPAYTLLNNRCKKAIACDLRFGPLERAERTRKKYKLEDRMELRLGSGLEPIEIDEADVIIMAGMGSYLITELINDSIEKAQKANYILLQPMTGQEIIRPYLWKNGFEILDESLTREGNKLYLVIMVKYTGNIRERWHRLHEYIGEKLIKKNDPHLIEWIKQHIRKQKKAISGLKRANSDVHNTQIEEEEKLLDGLYALLDVSGGENNEA